MYMYVVALCLLRAWDYSLRVGVPSCDTLVPHHESHDPRVNCGLLSLSSGQAHAIRQDSEERGRDQKSERGRESGRVGEWEYSATAKRRR
jgi:hypothetical protein